MVYEPRKNEPTAREREIKLQFRETFNSDSGEFVLDYLRSVIESMPFDRTAISTNSAIWYAAQISLMKTIENQL